MELSSIDIESFEEEFHPQLRYLLGEPLSYEHIIGSTYYVCDTTFGYIYYYNHQTKEVSKKSVCLVELGKIG